MFNHKIQMHSFLRLGCPALNVYTDMENGTITQLHLVKQHYENEFTNK